MCCCNSTSKKNSSGGSDAATPPGCATGNCPPAATTPPPVALEIVDRKTGSVISGTTQTKIVGQKVELRVRTRPAGQSMTNIQWTIPGQTVKSYTQSTSTATKTGLSVADLQAVDVDFYWIAGGNQVVQVAATVQGTALTASVTFDVKAPTAVSMTSATGAVAVSNPGFPDSGLELHYGTSTTPGISWTLRATAPAGGDGEIAGTQLINTNRTRTPNAGRAQTFSSGGAFVLDNTVPYAPSVAIAGGASATWTSDDSPGTPLTSNLRDKAVSDSFRLYLMYRPAGADSIWVTIARLDWDWAGQTTRVGAPADPGNIWNAPTGVSNTRNPSGSASTELPLWTDNFTSITWR